MIMCERDFYHFLYESIDDSNHESFIGLVYRPQEILQMVGLIFQKVNLLCPFLILSEFLLLYLFLQRVLLFFQFLGSLLKMALLFLQFQNGGIELGGALLGLQLFPHGEGQRTLIKSLVCTDCHV